MGCSGSKLDKVKEAFKQKDIDEDSLLDPGENGQEEEDPRLGVYRFHGEWYAISMTDDKKFQFNQEDADGNWEWAELKPEGDDYVGIIKANDSGKAVGNIRVRFNVTGKECSVAVHSFNGEEEVVARKDDTANWDVKSMASRASLGSLGSAGSCASMPQDVPAKDDAVHLDGVVVTEETDEKVNIASVALMYVIGGRSTRGALSSVEWLDGRTYTWKALPPMEKPLEDCASVVIEKNLFVVGGADGDTGDPLSTVICFDGETECWKAMPPMNVARSACAAAADGGLLYVVGGKSSSDAHSAVASVERFNIKTNVWEVLPEMKQARWACAAAILNGMLYVVGGCSGDGNALTESERFDPKSGRWEAISSLPTSRLACALVASADGLYVLGGCRFIQDSDDVKYLDTVQSFDPETNLWDDVGSMETARSFCAAVAVGDDVFIVGGIGTSEEPLSSGERFKTDKERFLMLPALEIARSRCAAAAPHEETMGEVETV